VQHRPSTQLHVPVPPQQVLTGDEAAEQLSPRHEPLQQEVLDHGLGKVVEVSFLARLSYLLCIRLWYKRLCCLGDMTVVGASCCRRRSGPSCMICTNRSSL
jgi:hypothetical protein